MQTNQTKHFESSELLTSFKKEKQEDSWNVGQAGSIT